MTRIITCLSLFTAVPAFAADTVPATRPSVNVTPESGGEAIISPDGTVQTVSPARVAAEIEAAAAVLRDETSNGSVIGRASMNGDVCGLQFDREATGRRAVQLAELYANCVRAEAVRIGAEGLATADRIDAEGRASNTAIALYLDRDLHSEGNESATGQAAAISALSDDEGGSPGLGGFGYGVPYGASPFQAVQTAGLGWQAIQAGQLAPPPVVQPAATTSNTAPTKKTEAKVEKVDPEVAAAKAAIERAKAAAGKE